MDDSTCLMSSGIDISVRSSEGKGEGGFGRSGVQGQISTIYAYLIHPLILLRLKTEMLKSWRWRLPMNMGFIKMAPTRTKLCGVSLQAAIEHPCSGRGPLSDLRALVATIFFIQLVVFD